MRPALLLRALALSAMALPSVAHSEDALSGATIEAKAAKEVETESEEKTADRVIATSISGFSQVDYVRREISQDELAVDTRRPLNEDQFSVRRARLIGKHAWRGIETNGMVELFSEGGVRPVSFDIRAGLPSASDEPPVIQLRAGLFPVPFGFESYEQSDTQRFFGERSLFVHSFVPGRFDMGAALSGHIFNVDWIVAVQNGEPLESGSFAYRDPNQAKDISGRIRVSGELLPGIRVALASSLLFGKGFSSGTPPSKDRFEWRDLDEDGRVVVAELIPIPATAGRASQNFRRWGLGGDLQVSTDLPALGELTVYGEAALGVNLDRGVAPADPILLGRDQRSFGFYVAGTQELTNYATFGLRFEQYEPNADALELFDGLTVITRRRFRTTTAGLSGNLQFTEATFAKLLLEYQYQVNSLGRDNRGRPANLDNDTLRVRLETVF